MYQGIFVCGNFTPKQAEKSVAAVWMTAHANSGASDCGEPVTMRCCLPMKPSRWEGGLEGLCGSGISSARLPSSGLCPVECLKTPRTEVACPPFKNNWAQPRNDTEQLFCHSWVHSSDTISVDTSRVPELDFPLTRVTFLCFRLSGWTQQPGIHS